MSQIVKLTHHFKVIVCGNRNQTTVSKKKTNSFLSYETFYLKKKRTIFFKTYNIPVISSRQVCGFNTYLVIRIF